MDGPHIGLAMDEEPIKLNASTSPKPGNMLRGAEDVGLVILQCDEILRRLDFHAELLEKALLRHPAHPPRICEKLEKQAAEVPTPTAHSAQSPVAKLPGRRPSCTPSMQLFTTFTQADLALRQRAAEVDGSVARQAFADASVSEMKDVPETRLQRWVRNPAFDTFFALVVLANSIFVAFQVQESIANSQESTAMTVTQICFTALFTVELLVRFAAFGLAVLCSEDRWWILLDIVIVTSSLFEVTLGLAMSGSSQQVSNVSSLKSIRIIRVTRILKTLRLVRVFRFIMALRTLVTSIVYTLRSLFWAMALLLLIVYVFAVLLAEAVSGYVQDPSNPALPDVEAAAVEKYYRSLFHTMLSLFMSISGGVSWQEVLAPLEYISSMWVMVFLFYVAFTYFAVLNVVTGVFCQSAIDSAQNDHANVVQSMLANKEAHVEKIRALFSQLGADKTGIITYAMFEEGLRSPPVIEYFETLGLDVWDAWSFFKLLDLDAGGSVEIEEFFKGCLRLRGQARGVDVGKLLHDQRWLIKAQGRFQTYVEAKVDEITEQLSELSGMPYKPFIRGMSPVDADDSKL
ncbi:unnamed protein product [Effrenium voratum]|uniref:Ion transport domain-containing protein n=1 Tax=Effrenium voratum TaxID=2562239 RepID=A0AA36I9U5_9DINO|nr:unnamed protein product [Effrenium voratum]CAJ1426431.1 unnamed protein product [Effrenium voratum]